jgi:molybdopterin/thiamine biosynthesis adenylyltransferase
VLGVLPGIVGSIQAIEAIKLILGIGEPLVGKLLMHRHAGHELPHAEGAARPDCPLCGEHPTVTN